MLVLARLVFLAIFLYMFISLFMNNFDDKRNSISNKIYLFLFVFIINFIFNVFGGLVSGKKLVINDFIETSINNALIAVIAFDVYNDLKVNDFFTKYTLREQRILILVLLIIGFIATIKILELLISST